MWKKFQATLTKEDLDTALLGGLFKISTNALWSFLLGTPGFEKNVDRANPRWLEKSSSSCVSKIFYGIDWTGLFEHSLTLTFSR